MFLSRRKPFYGHNLTSLIFWAYFNRKTTLCRDDGTVKIWELASGKQILSLSGHKGWVFSCAFSPDGSLIASASWDGTVKIWEVESGKLLRIHAVARFEHPSGRIVLSHAVWEPEGNRILDLGGEAWRYLAWVRWRPDAPPERLPLEAFKPT